ncbi:MAG: hypothetical protein JWO83_5065 [Caulobacteraceae bacterium]|nr:hypothetical protein [Caulobacteraceae bacterium]
MAKAPRAVLFAALLAPLQAQAGRLDTARTFTERLYEAYQHGHPDYLGALARVTFAPRLLALIRHDEAAASPGDVGVLDGDPICDCQDDAGLKAERIEIENVATGRALATVTLRFPAEATKVRLDLVSRRGRWRVADIRTKDVPSLVGLLEKSAASATAKARPSTEP